MVSSALAIMPTTVVRTIKTSNFRRRRQRMRELTRQAWLGLAKLVAILVLCLFLPAWSFDFWEAWTYVGVFGASVAAITWYLQKQDPELLRRRLAAGPAAETERRQKVIQAIASIAFAGIFLVAGLDHRVGWSNVSASLVLAGDVLVLLGLGIVFLVFRENSYSSATIETTDNQPVISTGPYAVVRHPMYAGASLFLIGTALALGSYWALPSVAVLAFVILLRLLDEERFLSGRLPGYGEYLSKIKYRLIPFIW
jgi:protein-S-isoprenylcysteine O-methyltransferase Ste14